MEMVEAMALVSGRVEEEILLRNEYLAAENEILKSKINKPLQLKNNERIRLAKIANRKVLYSPGISQERRPYSLRCSKRPSTAA